MRRPFLILIIMAISFLLSDIRSSNVVSGVIFPLIFSAATLVFILWLLRLSHKKQLGYKDTGTDSNAYLLSGKHHKGDINDHNGDSGSD